MPDADAAKACLGTGFDAILEIENAILVVGMWLGATRERPVGCDQFHLFPHRPMAAPSWWGTFWCGECTSEPGQFPRKPLDERHRIRKIVLLFAEIGPATYSYFSQDKYRWTI